MLIVKELQGKCIYMEPFYQWYHINKNIHAFLIDATGWLSIKAECRCLLPSVVPLFIVCLSNYDTCDLIATCFF